MTLSLHSRLLLAASVVLTAFFGLTGLVLERAYRHSAEQAVRDRLQGQVIALIAAIEPHRDGSVYLANALAEGRFFTVASGLYGQVQRNDGHSGWTSPSLEQQTLDVGAGLARGKQRFAVIQHVGEPLFVYSLGVSWDDKASFGQSYTFSVAESQRGYLQQLAAYHHLLWGWLGAVAIGLLVIQGSILRWGLAPLRRLATDLADIEANRQSVLQGHYPKELRGLTGNLNALLAGQRSRIQRYRHALGDLAHSLKTPLALLSGIAETKQPTAEQNHLLSEQIERMTRIVDYQLQRAAASGRTVLSGPVMLQDLADKVMAALNKVYASKGVRGECEIEPELHSHADHDDLMEVLGNLLDNAYKWCRQRVLLTVTRIHDETSPGIELCVEDDGDGIDNALREHVLQRGNRADETTAGHGIGLAVVQNIAEAYGGAITITRSRWQGARVCVRLPASG